LGVFFQGKPSQAVVVILGELIFYLDLGGGEAISKLPNKANQPVGCLLRFPIPYLDNGNDFSIVLCDRLPTNALIGVLGSGNCQEARQVRESSFKCRNNGDNPTQDLDDALLQETRRNDESTQYRDDLQENSDTSTVCPFTT